MGLITHVIVVLFVAGTIIHSEPTQTSETQEGDSAVEGEQSPQGDLGATFSNSDDGGRYSGMAIILGPASIVAPPRNVTKLEGDRTEFICRAKALPTNVTHRWFRNGVEISQLSWLETRTSVRRDGTLFISPTAAEDSGKFTCEVTNGIGTPDTASAFLSVEYPARVTFSPTIQYLPLGESGVIRCYVQASPPLEFITWIKENRPYIPTSISGVVTLTNGSLLFQRVSHEDQGRYRCTPYNIHGTAGTSNIMDVIVRDRSEIQIEVAKFGDNSKTETDSLGNIVKFVVPESTFKHTTSFPGPASIVTPPRNVTKLESDRVVFICKAKALPTNVTHRWFHNGVEISQLSWLETRTSVRRDGTLFISPTSAEDSGKFTCEVTNGIGNPATASAFLSVEYPAKVTFSPKLQYLQLGLSGVIRCYVQASPRLEFITWTKENRQYDPTSVPGVVTLTNGSLLFQRVSHDDQGRYRCTPYNIHGTAGTSDIMDVLVREPPMYTMKPKEIYQKPVDSEIKLPCEGVGQPKPAITWRRADGSKLPRDRSMIRGGNLTIRGLRKEDHGRYECVLENEIATLVTSTFLLVETADNVGGSTSITEVITVTSSAENSSGNSVSGDLQDRNRSKAITTGVVEGIFFFAAAIVPSVCAVKICNKRKRRKGEKDTRKAEYQV